MSRLVALLVAIGLIVGAVAVRNLIEEDERVDDGRQAVLRITCASEVAPACEGLGLRYETTTEDAAATADRLTADPDPDVDLWIVPQPWPAIVDDVRTRAGFDALFQESVVVARSALVAVAVDTVGDCDWACIGSAEHRVGSRALDSGPGLLQVGAAAAGYFGRSDFATNDFDPGFDAWLARLASSIVPAEAPVTRLLQSQAFFEIALSHEAEAETALASAAAARKEGLRLLYPAPVAHLEVAVAATGDLLVDRAEDLPDVAGSALVTAGWRPPADEPNGLPRPGVLVALREELT